jgi:hypothetical protein
MTAEKIIIKWLIGEAKSSDPWFYTYDFEQRVPMYGRLAHQKVHTASTYSRAFRKIRESNTLRRYGLTLEEITHKDNKGIKGWKVLLDS